MGRDSIAYSMDDNPQQHGSMNEAVSVKNDDQSLYFQALGMQSGGSRDKQKLTAQGAAELFWELFLRCLSLQAALFRNPALIQQLNRGGRPEIRILPLPESPYNLPGRSYFNDLNCRWPVAGFYISCHPV